MRYLTEEDQHVTFELDARISDRSQRYRRQVDIWLPKSREIVECKNHTRLVGVGAVDALVGAIDDTDAHGGRIFSNSGFTSIARARAEKAGISCIELPYADQVEFFHTSKGGGTYYGDYLDLCWASTKGCDSVGRINYCDEEGVDLPIVVGSSVDWGNVQMRGFIAYILLAHQLGKPPAEWTIDNFVYEHGSMFESGFEWTIDEGKVSHLAVA
ncbi:restriction endonuclease [Micromonospora echinofusca]|uniref:restriction endonuclease n=2 Tax=Micromonospora TaxID=1873 RepID=UPI003406B24B